MVIDTDSYDEPMVVTHPHALPLPTVLDRLKGFTFALRRQYEGRVAESSESWNGSTLTYSIVGVRGRRIHGTVTADGNTITVVAEGDIPTFVKGRVEREIKAALVEALGS